MRKVLVLRQEVRGSWCRIVRADHRGDTRVLERACDVSDSVGPDGDVGVDEEQHVPTGVPCAQVPRGRRTAWSGHRDDARAGAPGLVCRRVAGTIVNDENLERSRIECHEAGKASDERLAAVADGHDDRNAGLRHRVRTSPGSPTSTQSTATPRGRSSARPASRYELGS